MSEAAAVWIERWLDAAARSKASSPAGLRAVTVLGEPTLFARATHPGFRFAFDSATTDLSASGIVHRIRSDTGARLGKQATALLHRLHHVGPADAPRLPLVGGRAFDGGLDHTPWETFGEATLVLPRFVFRRVEGRVYGTVVLRAGETIPEVGSELAFETAPSVPSLTSDTAVERDPREDFEIRVRGVVDRIRAGELQKVVLSRRSRMLRGADEPMVWARLSRPDPHSARFLMAFGGRSLVGASPELLVRLRGAALETDALAGSAPPDEGEALQRSNKDQEEHAKVVEHLRSVLQAQGAEPRHAVTPMVRDLGYVCHLWTPVTARVHGGDAWDWASALHPTPATGGWPCRDALRVIREIEPDPRGWYCGALGWVDAAGDGEFYVALRSALLEPKVCTVFVGVGLVAGSDPGREWRETLWKERAMLGALGVGHAV